MPLLDQDPIDPEIAATLDAIDATLAGEPVDGRYADIAEIALLLASDRPQVPPAFASSLDQKVERRFEPQNGQKRRFGTDRSRKRRSPSGVWQGAGAIAAGVATIAAIAVVAGGGHGGSSGASSSASATSTSAASSSAASAGSAPSGHSSASRSPKAQAALIPPTNSEAGSSASGSPALGSSASGTSAPTVQPPTTGRKVVQGAQLNLTAAPNRVDDVAQEIYDVVGQANGIVESSSVTQGGPGGYANFQLSMPSAALGQTMTQLSSLNYAQVVSRTDSSQDITDQYGAATRALADARALRTSLLKQLASADDDRAGRQPQGSDPRRRGVDLERSGDAQPPQPSGRTTARCTSTSRRNPRRRRSRTAAAAFTLGRAAHDAGRVLMVARAWR